MADESCVLAEGAHYQAYRHLRGHRSWQDCSLLITCVLLSAPLCCRDLSAQPFSLPPLLAPHHTTHTPLPGGRPADAAMQQSALVLPGWCCHAAAARPLQAHTTPSALQRQRPHGAAPFCQELAFLLSCLLSLLFASSSLPLLSSPSCDFVCCPLPCYGRGAGGAAHIDCGAAHARARGLFRPPPPGGPASSSCCECGCCRCLLTLTRKVSHGWKSRGGRLAGCFMGA